MEEAQKIEKPEEDRLFEEKLDAFFKRREEQEKEYE